MKLAKKILTVLFGVMMMGAGVVHFTSPAAYVPMVPNFLPQSAVVFASGVVEIVVGLGTLIPRFRAAATLLILVLMLAYLPLHVLDVFREHPAIGSHKLALIRLPFQFVLIAWAWFIHQKDALKPAATGR
ncbi:DoxX family protein [Hymenobacter terrenus]|uniref:DoxX family protein n=1 Tax=Hymenobacter terrenus TaxID=1629124 RepID=UPI000619CB20|nr:hypothetical protein [Hymenobacter terrenus]